MGDRIDTIDVWRGVSAPSGDGRPIARCSRGEVDAHRQGRTPTRPYRTPWASPSAASPTTQLGPASVSSEQLRVLGARIRHLALQRDLAGLSNVARDSIAELVPADRARCLFYDAEQGQLWSESSTGDPAELDHGLGISGRAARTGRVQLAHYASTDPQYCPAVDDPVGDGSERISCVPIVSSTGQTHAVVTLVRSASCAPFDAREIELVALWARQAAPLFEAHHLEMTSPASTPAPEQGVAMFRPTAIEARLAGQDDFGSPLPGPPGWSLAAYWALLLFVVAGLVYGAVARVKVFATGPAVVIAPGHRDVTAPAGGVVSEILVRSGDVVSRGDALVALHSDTERADLQRARGSFERALEARLRRPADAQLEREVARMKLELERAQARLESRLIRAPDEGSVADLHVGEGQAVKLGDVALTMSTHRGSPRIRAFVPGKYRPSLEAGQPMMVDVDGFEHATQRLEVTAVGSEALGPAEMDRMLGSRLADSVKVEGAVVLVEAELPDMTIEAADRRWTLHDGMFGQAHVEVDREPVVFALFPGLQDMLSDG